MSIYKRFIYDNYLRPSRLNLYSRLMDTLKDKGYQCYTIDDFNTIINNKTVLPNKVLLLRHDVDTDPKTAWLIAKIEHEHGYHGTYYFRIRTANEKYINLISEMGHEVSYHYEEIGTYAKKHKLRTKEQVYNHLQEIRSIFIQNLNMFREKYHLQCRTIASHGEWINAHYLHVRNLELIDDCIRKEHGIELEAYDEKYMKFFINARISDLGTPLWNPYPVEDAVINEEPFIYILIHPRQWYSRWSCNFIADMERLYETIKYKINF